jgi:hypothetical protein
MYLMKKKVQKTKSKFDISELLSFEKSTVKNWLDKLRFSYIFLVWFGIVSLYGLIYYYFSSPTNHLFDTISRTISTSLWEALYFSFVTATTTGFGDLVPMGHFKIISVAEVISGLLLLAIVTSKFVSIKQDQIMKELYDISLHEKISRLRSSLFLYKQHLNRLSSNAIDGNFKTVDLKNLGMYFRNYEDVLVESLTLILSDDDSDSLVDVDLDLLTKSIINSATKTLEASDIFENNNILWVKNNKDLLLVVADLNGELFNALKKSNSISDSTKKLLDKSLKKLYRHLKDILT